MVHVWDMHFGLERMGKFINIVEVSKPNSSQNKSDHVANISIKSCLSGQF